MPQAFLAWDTGHVLSTRPCCDDHRQPRRCGQFCSPGCTGCHRVTPCLGVADPRGPSRTHLAVVLQRLVRATDPKFRRGHAPVIPYVRTAEPWIRRRRIPPSSCHSLRADNQARASSRTHLRRRVRPPRVQTAHLRVHPRAPGHPHPTGRHLRRGHSTRPGACRPGRGRSTPSGTVIPSPHAQDAPGRAEMSPHAQDVPSHGA